MRRGGTSDWWIYVLGAWFLIELPVVVVISGLATGDWGWIETTAGTRTLLALSPAMWLIALLPILLVLALASFLRRAWRGLRWAMSQDEERRRWPIDP